MGRFSSHLHFHVASANNEYLMYPGDEFISVYSVIARIQYRMRIIEDWEFSDFFMQFSHHDNNNHRLIHLKIINLKK